MWRQRRILGLHHNQPKHPWRTWVPQKMQSLPTSLDHVNHFVDLRSCGVARPNVGIRSELSPIPSDVKDELASAPIPVILRTNPCSFSNLHGLGMIYLSSTNPLRQVLTFTQIPINQTPTRPWLILTPLSVFYHLSRDVCVPHMY